MIHLQRHIHTLTLALALTLALTTTDSLTQSLPAVLLIWRAFAGPFLFRFEMKMATRYGFALSYIAAS
jgi:hypothetical protein